MELKDRLRNAMKMRGVSAQKVADNTGISKSSISLYLNGSRTPKTEQIKRLSKYLNVDVMYLMGYSTYTAVIVPDTRWENPEPNAKELLIKEIENEIWNENEDDLRRILSVIKAMKGSK